MTSDEAPEPVGSDDGDSHGSWRQADLKRALAAAKQADLQNYRVEIAPDGTISIIVGEPG